MSIDSGLHHRRSIRIPGYDYASPGRYYVTLCVRNRERLLGDVINGEMRLNAWGHVIQRTWNGLPDHYPSIMMDAFVIMPNHIHGIIVITDWGNYVGAQFNCAPTKSESGHPLGQIVRSIKSFTSREINALRGTPGISVWQRNYFERIIRNETELNRIRKYIAENPMKWELDSNNPGRQSGARFDRAPTKPEPD